MIINFPKEELVPMKVIDMSTKANAKAYLTRPVKDTHSVAELEALHNAIRFTHENKMNESLEKMDTEELIERPLPRL